jgi:ApeA N-terminal domain 1
VPPVRKTAQLLTEGKTVAGEFWPSHGGDPAHGILNWTAVDGCQIEIIGTAKGWDAGLGGPRFTLHGVTTLGEEISLLDAWVNQISGDEITRLHASTLGIGSLTIPDERWTRAVYSTANLGEWCGENGLNHSGPTRRRPRLHRVDFDPPESEEVKLPRAMIRLGISAQSVVAYAPNWSIETWGEFAVFPDRKFTLDQAHHDYGQPLLSFTHFALDRPDSLAREVVVGDTFRRQMEILREGNTPVIPRWKLNPAHFLFHRPDVRDLSRGFRRWWALHHETRPALGLFADHISSGNSYSPSRLLTLYTALERYAKVRFGRKNEFRDLRAYGGIPSELTGCTNGALKLLGASRGFFAHGETKGAGITADEIEGSALNSIRRASALMQACLLREVGFRKQARIDLMARHYQSWRIP